MEMDYNLKKIASLFKFYLCIVQKSLKSDYILFFLKEIPNIFFLMFRDSNFMSEKRFFVKKLSSFDQNISNSP